MEPLVNIPLDPSADTSLDDQTLSSFAIQNATVFDGTSVSFHPTKAFEPRLGNPMMRKSRWRTAREKAGALAGFASVTALIFTLLLCRNPYYRKTEPLIAGRKLSSDSDSSDEDFVAFCHQVYAESKRSSSTELEHKALPEEAGLPPAAKVARLDTGGLGEASLGAGHGKVPMPRPSVLRYAPPRSQPGSTSFGDGSAPERQAPERKAVSALLDLLHARGTKDKPATSLKPIAEDPLVAAGPLSSKTSAEVWKPLTSSRTFLSRSQILGEIITPLLEEGEASSTTGSGSGVSVVGGPLASHPFFRVPAANPADLQRPLFSSHIALSLSMVSKPVTMLLNDLRCLLTEDKLAPEGLREVAHLVHSLVASAYRSEGASVATKQKKVAVFVMGRRFLVLDTVLAALHVLGEPASGDWWDEFTQAINHEHVSGVKPRGRSIKALFNDALLRMLVRGILHLKTGSRMPSAETVLIKRMLFCSPQSPPSFQQNRWDMWRLDDEFFRSSKRAADLGAPPQR